MFPEIKDFVYDTIKEANTHITKIQKAFLNRTALGVNEYYELMNVTPIPEEANDYCWPDINYFVLRKDYVGYHVTALDPIRIQKQPGIYYI